MSMLSWCVSLQCLAGHMETMQWQMSESSWAWQENHMMCHDASVPLWLRQIQTMHSDAAADKHTLS